MTEPAGGASTATEFRTDDLRIARLRALRGPNYWRLAPVIGCDVHLGSLAHLSSADVPGFADRLAQLLPSLHAHTCSRGAAGGFLQRLHEGTSIPHILEHVALELQSLVGNDVGFGRAVESGDPGVWWVMVAYEEEDVGLRSVRDAVEIVRCCLAGEPVDVARTVAALRELYEEVRLGPSTAAIVEEARRRGIPVRRLDNRSTVQLGLGRHLRRIQATMTDRTSAIAVDIAQDKNETKRVLSDVGLPVPRGGVAGSLRDALDLARELRFPVVVKPLDASQGRGISGPIADDAALRRAWDVAREVSSRIVIEEYVGGKDHRVLVVDGKVVAVAERVAAHVVGDGVHRVRELIDIANGDPRRGHGHRKLLTFLPADRGTAEFLARSGRSLDDVPARDEIVFLRGTANLSTGGISIDRTDEIHPDNITACEMAAAAVGLDVAGVDVITPDIAISFRDDAARARIVEVNAAPGIRMHTHPAVGTPRNVGGAIVDMLYPPGVDSTIPIIAITGTNGKTTTVRLVAHLFRHTGRAVGFTTTDGIYLQNRLVMEGDMTGPFSASIILSNPTVDVAVLETARGGLLRAGLGFEEADVGVVLNVSGDHLGLGGIHTIEQLADVKSVVAQVVKREGHAVLNADDPLVHAMRERTPGDVVLFSCADAAADGASPGARAVEEHIAVSGIAARVEDETFVIRRGRLRIPIAGVREVPLTLGGAARFQLGNVLAAIATAYVQGLRYDDIRAGLLSFFPSPSMTPGRLNLMRVADGKVLVDYAHNPAALDGVIALARRIPARRRIGVIAAPGDRRDQDIRALGERAAAFDRLVIKEDDDLRGREPGEVAALLADGARAGGLASDRVATIRSEQEAVRHAVDAIEPGDLVVILAADVRAVLRQVQARASGAAAV